MTAAFLKKKNIYIYIYHLPWSVWAVMTKYRRLHGLFITEVNSHNQEAGES